ncbi:MAG: hypothetical protein ABI054_13720, partial [Planctomycetota bacterium]
MRNVGHFPSSDWLVRCSTSAGRCLTLALLLLARDAGAAPVQAGCQPTWMPTFTGQAGTSERLYALTAFHDSVGSALYAAGNFVSAGGVTANSIARWNGSSWSALGS